MYTHSFKFSFLSLFSFSLFAFSASLLACDKHKEPNSQTDPAVESSKKLVLKSGTKPKPIKRKSPEYPKAAAIRGQEGWVKLNYAIDTEGRVKHIDVVDHSGERLFTHAARRAVQRWKFEPATLAGKPVYSCQNSITLDFKMLGKGKVKGASEKFIKIFNQTKEFAIAKDLEQFKTSLSSLKKLALNRYEQARYHFLRSVYGGMIGDLELKVYALEQVKNYGKTSIESEIYLKSMRDLYLTQMDLGLFTQGLETYKMLEKFNGLSSPAFEPIVNHKKQVVRLLKSDKPVCDFKTNKI